MEEEQEKESLYMPQGLKKKREYFDGYGRYEFQVTIVVTLITAIICGVFYLASKNLVASVFTLLAVPCAAVLFLVRNECNISVVDQIKFMIRFAKEQKEYPYVYQDEWRT